MTVERMQLWSCEVMREGCEDCGTTAEGFSLLLVLRPNQYGFRFLEKSFFIECCPFIDKFRHHHLTFNFHYRALKPLFSNVVQVSLGSGI